MKGEQKKNCTLYLFLVCFVAVRGFLVVYCGSKIIAYIQNNHHGDQWSDHIRLKKKKTALTAVRFLHEDELLDEGSILGLAFAQDGAHTLYLQLLVRSFIHVTTVVITL